MWSSGPTFRRCISVIKECFEVFIDRPSSLMAQTQTGSNYIQNNAVKSFMGITPVVSPV